MMCMSYFNRLIIIQELNETVFCNLSGFLSIVLFVDTSQLFKVSPQCLHLLTSVVQRSARELRPFETRRMLAVYKEKCGL